MASIAGRIATVVHHIDRKGCGAGMTQVTVRVAPGRKRNMSSIRVVCSTLRGRAVMACAAYTRNSAVMITGSQPGNCIQVTGIAIGCCAAMCGALALRSYPIVATHAYAGRRRPVVLECRRNPGHKIMAVVTVIGCHPGSGMGG